MRPTFFVPLGVALTLPVALALGQNPAALKQDEQACAAGAYDACFRAGKLYDVGKVVEWDEDKANDLYKRGVQLASQACDRDVALACATASDAYQNGVGVKKNGDVASSFYRRAVA